MKGYLILISFQLQCMIVLVCETCLKFDLVLKCYITGAASRCSYVSGVKSSCFNSFFSLFVQGSWTLCVRSFKLKVRHVCKRGLIGITFRELNYIFLRFKTNLRTSELFVCFHAANMEFHLGFSINIFKATYNWIVKYSQRTSVELQNV